MTPRTAGFSDIEAGERTALLGEGDIGQAEAAAGSALGESLLCAMCALV